MIYGLIDIELVEFKFCYSLYVYIIFLFFSKSLKCLDFWWILLVYVM